MPVLKVIKGYKELDYDKAYNILEEVKIKCTTIKMKLNVV